MQRGLADLHKTLAAAAARHRAQVAALGEASAAKDVTIRRLTSEVGALRSEVAALRASCESAAAPARAARSGGLAAVFKLSVLPAPAAWRPAQPAGAARRQAAACPA